MRRIFTSLCALFFLLPFNAQSQIFINEYSAANMSAVGDNNGEYHDWVELYNAGSSSVSLTGYCRSDNSNNQTQRTFPSGSLPAGGFVKVICSGYNVVSGAFFH